MRSFAILEKRVKKRNKNWIGIDLEGVILFITAAYVSSRLEVAVASAVRRSQITTVLGVCLVSTHKYVLCL